jgi:RNA polymerase sigma-70 factor (ECF subfamily)
MVNTIEDSQEKLLLLASQGDKHAFGMLYSHYLDEIYRFVYFKISNEQIAEDITEETFLKTWNSLSKIYKKDGKVDNFRAWLYRVANNLVIDFYRKKKPVFDFNRTWTKKQPLPEDLVLKEEQSNQLVRMIKSLEPVHQEIIILRLVNDLSHKEVAEIMNISEGYSRVLLYRALKEIKSMLEKKEGKDA